MKKIFILLILAVNGWSAINSNGDFQIWTRATLRSHFHPVWNFLVFEENRIGDHASKLFHVILQAQLLYSPNKWLCIAPGYRQGLVRVPLNSTHWEPNYIPLCDLFLKKEVRDWSFSDRSRLMYIIEENVNNHWLYRNRFRIVTPWHFTRFSFTPFVDNELFFRQGFGFNQDRLSAGLMMIFYGNFSGQIFYMRRYLRVGHSSDWIHTNILYTTLLLAF